MARPAKIDAEKRDRVVSFRLTGGEYGALQAKAAVAGVEPAEFSRLAALGHAVRARRKTTAADPAVSFAVVDQLRRIGVNLNQLTRVTYLGHDRSDELGAAAHELRQVLAEVRSVLDRAHGG